MCNLTIFVVAKASFFFLYFSHCRQRSWLLKKQYNLEKKKKQHMNSPKYPLYEAGLIHFYQSRKFPIKLNEVVLCVTLSCPKNNKTLTVFIQQEKKRVYFFFPSPENLLQW